MSQQNLGFRWCLILGGFSFLVGFIGPMILDPGANQGPLFGIFISGPIGFIAGLALWVCSKSFRWSMRTQWRAMYAGCALAVMSVIAVAIWPSPDWLGRLYEIEVTACRPVAGEADAVISAWGTRTESFSWKTPRHDWQNDVQRTLGADAGSLLETKVLSEKIVKKEKPLFRDERLSAYQLTTQAPQTVSFYIAEPCTNLPQGAKSIYFVRQGSLRIMPTKSGAWPPVDVSNLLMKDTLLPVPEGMRGVF